MLAAHGHALTCHALHHARYTGHFGLGATFLDRLFGSECSDWSALQARVITGRALTSLEQRG